MLPRVLVPVILPFNNFYKALWELENSVFPGYIIFILIITSLFSLIPLMSPQIKSMTKEKHS